MDVFPPRTIRKKRNLAELTEFVKRSYKELPLFILSNTSVPTQVFMASETTNKDRISDNFQWVVIRRRNDYFDLIHRVFHDVLPVTEKTTLGIGMLA